MILVLKLLDSVTFWKSIMQQEQIPYRILDAYYLNLRTTAGSTCTHQRGLLSSKKIQNFESKSQIDLTAKHFEPCDSSVGVKTAAVFPPPTRISNDANYHSLVECKSCQSTISKDYISHFILLEYLFSPLKSETDGRMIIANQYALYRRLLPVYILSFILFLSDNFFLLHGLHHTVSKDETACMLLLPTRLEFAIIFFLY